MGYSTILLEMTNSTSSSNTIKFWFDAPMRKTKKQPSCLFVRHSHKHLLNHTHLNSPKTKYTHHTLTNRCVCVFLRECVYLKIVEFYCAIHLNFHFLSPNKEDTDNTYKNKYFRLKYKIVFKTINI